MGADGGSSPRIQRPIEWYLIKIRENLILLDVTLEGVEVVSLLGLHI